MNKYITINTTDSNAYIVEKYDKDICIKFVSRSYVKAKEDKVLPDKYSFYKDLFINSNRKPRPLGRG